MSEKHAIDDIMKSLKQLSERVVAQEELLEGDPIVRLAEATRKLAAAELEIRRLTEQNRDLSERVAGQATNIRSIRKALNGAGCNPLAEHAAKVMGALMQADPKNELLQPRPD